MSRYLLLLLFNTPIIIAGVLSIITQYKMGHAPKKRMLFQVACWMALFIGLALAQIIYETLFARGLTQTESLSLFDVVQITLITVLLYVFNRTRLKLELLETRVKDLHQELSIRLSKPPKK